VPFRKHVRAAGTHERAALLHEAAARFWEDAEDSVRSERENDLASKEREGATLEWDRARTAGYVPQTPPHLTAASSLRVTFPHAGQPNAA
jgi:hypothetical protein